MLGTYLWFKLFIYMVYFLTVNLYKNFSDHTEDAIRNQSSKRHTSLDLKQSSTYINQGKSFLGLENKHELKITRFRTPFEYLFPKLIVSFSKQEHFNNYRIRFSLSTFLIFVFLVFSFLNSVYSSFKTNEIENDFWTIFIVLIVLIVLTIIEIRITKMKIIKALEDFNLTLIGGR